MVLTVGYCAQFLGMAGPRAPGHREKFGGKHVCFLIYIFFLSHDWAYPTFLVTWSSSDIENPALQQRA